MLAIEEVLRELSGDEVNEQGLPPGFRFHPTDEELVTFYLASKVFNGTFSGVDIAEVDLNRCEPWELPEVAKMGEREWYFFSLRDRKYPTGLRTNRATGAGYWKATGKDRQVFNAAQQLLIGMKKTLVFYRGRAPRGEKTKWVMHEYRLDGHFSLRHSSKEEWVICRIYHKSGDKRNPLFQGRQVSSHLLQPCLPKPLQNPTPDNNADNTTTATSIHNTIIDQDYRAQNPMQTLMPNPNYAGNHHYHHVGEPQAMNGFRPVQTTSFSPPRDAPASMLFTSLLSHQEYCAIWKEQPRTSSTAVFKQCKTESDFSDFQVQPPQAPFVDDHYRNPNILSHQILLDSDHYGRPLGPSSADHDDDMSASLAFIKSTFQPGLSDNPLTKLAAESCWPLSMLD